MKIRTFGYLIPVLLVSFIFGTYAEAVLSGTRLIKTEQWVFVSIVWVLGLAMFIKESKKSSNIKP